MGLPSRYNRVQVDLLVDFGVAIKKNKIVPVLGAEDGFELSLTFRIPTTGMVDTPIPEEELRRLQNHGIAAFSRMAVTLLQFRTEKEAQLEMVAVGHGIYLFNLKMNLSRLFLDFARQKNAMQQLLDFTAHLTNKTELESFRKMKKKTKSMKLLHVGSANCARSITLLLKASQISRRN